MHPILSMLAIFAAGACPAVAVGLLWRATIKDEVQPGVPLAAHRALADELAAVTKERDLLRRQLAAVEE